MMDHSLRYVIGVSNFGQDESLMAFGSAREEKYEVDVADVMLKRVECSRLVLAFEVLAPVLMSK